MEESNLESSATSTSQPDAFRNNNEDKVTKEDLLDFKAELRDSMATRVDLTNAKEDLRSEIKQSNAVHWVFWGTTLMVANRYIFPRILDWLNGL